MNLLKQLRVEQLYRIHDKVLIIERVWDGEGDRPCTLYIAEEESTNEAAEIADAQAKIAANLSNPITEIAKLYGVSKKDKLTPDDKEIGSSRNTTRKH